MRVAVIGVGGTGSATCRYLAKRGHSVVGYERFRVGHERGSSHGESRIIRYTYPDLLYTQMMGDAYPLWAELEAEAGEELLSRCGGLYFGKNDEPSIHETERALIGAGLPYDRLTAHEVESRFPAFRLANDEIALYQPESGLLRATRCVLANARLAVEAGATLREQTVVTEIVTAGSEVIVRTDSGEESVFDRVIVTAGAWMGELFARLRLPLTVTRQQVTYLNIAQNPAHFEKGSLPVWIDATTLYYGFPNDGRLAGAKIASHVLGESVDPNAPKRDVDSDYIEAVRDYARKRLPDLSGEVTYQTTCLYTVTPNEDFILDRVPESPNVWLVSGCSGHGFKFTVLLGEIAARLALGETYHKDLSRFRIRAFD